MRVTRLRELEPRDLGSGVSGDHTAHVVVPQDVAPGGLADRSDLLRVGAVGEPDPVVIRPDHHAVVGDVELDDTAGHGDGLVAVVDVRTIAVGEWADAVLLLLGRWRLVVDHPELHGTHGDCHNRAGSDGRNRRRPQGAASSGATNLLEGRRDDLVAEPAQQVQVRHGVAPPCPRAVRPAGFVPSTAGT